METSALFKHRKIRPAWEGIKWSLRLQAAARTQAAARGRPCPSEPSTSERAELPTRAQPPGTFLPPMSLSPRHRHMSPSSLTLYPGTRAYHCPASHRHSRAPSFSLTTQALSPGQHEPGTELWPQVSQLDPSSSSGTHDFARASPGSCATWASFPSYTLNPWAGSAFPK